MTGVLRIGCVPDLPLQRLQAFLGALYARVPGSLAEVAHLRSAEQARRIRRGELDLGLVHDAPRCASLETTRVFPGEPLHVFLPTGHPLGSRRALGPDDMSEEVLLMFSRAVDPGLYERILTIVGRAGYRFREVRETGGSDVRDLVFAVAEADGIAVAPACTANVVGELAAIVTGRPLDPPATMPDTAIATPEKPVPGLAQAISVARQLGGELYGLC